MVDRDAVPTLECPCGMRLRAPGAHPGRVGRCPRCGGTLQFPEAAAATVEPPPEPMRRRREAVIPVGGGHAGNEETTLRPGRLGRSTEARRAELAEAARTVGRGGIIPLPRRTGFGLRDALLYPIWDGAGLSWLVVMPFGLAGLSLVTFGLGPEVVKFTNLMVLAPFVLPLILVFVVGVGYWLQVLNAIIIRSAAGEIHHPRWPEMGFGLILAGFFHWFLAGAAGLALTALPALSYARAHPQPTGANRLIEAGILSLGLIYSLMALASVVLRDDPLGANPLVVLRAILRGGLAYLQTCAIGIASCIIATFTVFELFVLENVGRTIFGAWAAWVVIVYLSMVVARSLGGLCHHRRKEIGWFRERIRVDVDGKP